MKSHDPSAAPHGSRFCFARILRVPGLYVG